MSTAQGDTTDSLLGQKLGDYTLLRLLATGGIARIYEGEDERLGRLAAVKVLDPSMMEFDQSLARRFDREARAVAALEHDNIIHIYQYGEKDGSYFLAMKLIRGVDLAQEFKKYRRSGARMEVERLLYILGQVASALDYAHMHNVVHRDVKPSNILIDENDKATLTDFGLVLNQSIEATLGTAFGTPRYIAPEQAVASSKAVPQSDIYSLGIIVYEALTGDAPFTGNTPMDIAMAHVTEVPTPARSRNPQIPAVVDAALMRVLEKEPTKRFNSAREFINTVRRAYGLAVEEARQTREMQALRVEVNPTHPSIPTLPDQSYAATESAARLPRALSPAFIGALIVGTAVITAIITLALRGG